MARCRSFVLSAFAIILGLLLPLSTLWSAGVEAVDARVTDAEARRVAVVERVKPAVVAVFAAGGQGGGSGVLISPDGFALTNFHVVQGGGPVMQCGLPDGVLYDAVLVGLDKVGDVALIKLLQKPEGKPFPAATLGDSDTVRAGDWSLAMGNPFLLATDFTPTVTFGLVSGIHRYQYPSGTLLEYTDCIQVDTSINPGNSGGPLFDLKGELIGINGRGSFEKRGRVNSGVGYAISINQIKNFLGHLRVGLDTDHATLGARIQTDNDEGGGQTMVVKSLLEDADAARRGLDLDDELVSFAGRPMTSVNQFKNVLGLYPKGWRVPLVYRRSNVKKEILVRLSGLQRAEAEEGKPKPHAGPAQPKATATPSPALKFFEAKPGFANYYFNKFDRERLLSAFKKRSGDFGEAAGMWTLDADVETGPRRPVTRARLTVSEEKDVDGKGEHALAHLDFGGLTYDVEPLRSYENSEKIKDPPSSGGLLAGFYLYRRLLLLGGKGFEGGFSHGGREPFYPPPTSGRVVSSLKELRVDTEVLLSEHGAYQTKWYFSPQDQSLLGFEVQLHKHEDPCEFYLADYRQVNGRLLPHRIEVRHADKLFGIFTVRDVRLDSVKPAK